MQNDYLRKASTPKLQIGGGWRLLDGWLNTDIKIIAHVEESAWSDEIGHAILFSRGGNSQSSLARSAVEFSSVHQSEEIQVSRVILDSYLSDHHVPFPRCVKIDAEGAEIRILKGAKRILASGADIVCELHPYAWREFGNTFAEFKQLATTAGRRIRYLDQDIETGDQAEYGTVLLERCS